MANGRQHDYPLTKHWGPATNDTYLSLADAIDEAREIRAMARAGVDYRIHLDEQRLEKIKLDLQGENEEKLRIETEAKDLATVSELFEKWVVDGVSRADDNTELRRSFSKDLLPHIGPVPIKQLTDHQLRTALRIMVERGADRLAVMAYNNLVQMFAWAEQRQPWRRLLADGNPIRLVEMTRVVSPGYDFSNQRSRHLSPEEIQELHATFTSMTTLYDRSENKRTAARPVVRTTEIAIWLMLSTLCRVGELSKARWKSIDLEKGQWIIPKADTKGKRADFLVLLSPFATEKLRALKVETGSSDWCFPNVKNTNHIDVKAISKQIADRQASLKNVGDDLSKRPMKNRTKDQSSLILSNGADGSWTSHDLRRTGSTLMQSLGIDPDLIDRCQNHIILGPKVRRHYQLFQYAAEKRTAWCKLGDYLDSLIRAVPSPNKIGQPTQ